MNGMMIGSKSGRHYSFLPCPFDSTAEMKLQYRAGEGENLFITTKVYYNTEARNKQDEGKLYTFWHREINPKQGECYDFLSVKGRGHYVGTIHNAQGLYPNNMVFFEGDDSTYVDGKCEFMAPVPKITTTEDGMTCRENGIAPKAYRFMVVWIIIYKQHVPEDFAFIQQTSFPLKKNFIWE